MIQNVVVGTPLVHPSELLAESKVDWESNEEENTMFTEERFLPRILVMAGLVKSVNEVRRNQPHLVRELNQPDFYRIKWGKKFLWILVGE